MTKIYTRTGDTGETSLLGGVRVRKDDLRIEAIGTVDETNAALGVVRVELQRSGVAPAGLDELVTKVQHRLFDIGAELASPGGTSRGIMVVTAEDVAELEAEIDRWDAPLAPLQTFILPGGASAAAQLHWSRCVCRRAERRLVQLAAHEAVRGQLVQFINRLSDLLFVLARATNAANRVPDVKWESKTKNQ